MNVPHFAGKFGVERMIEQMKLGATILRPAYYMDNEITIKDVVTGYGIYPMPIGDKGLAMIDARDVGELAAIELIRREQSPTSLPLDYINVVGPDTLHRRRRSGDLVGCPRSHDHLPPATTPPGSSRTCASSCRAGWPSTCA